MNYIEDRKIGRNDIKSGWIVVAIANLGLAAMAL